MILLFWVAVKYVKNKHLVHFEIVESQDKKDMVAFLCTSFLELPRWGVQKNQY